MQSNIIKFGFLMLTLLTVTACSVNTPSQEDRKFVRSGNKLFRQNKFEEASTEYKKALSVNKSNPQAVYNLGCAELNLQQDSTAISLFEEAAKYETNKIRKAMAYHNIGVVFHANQKYDAAIEAYKEALRNNPADNETRYNLELAKRQQKNNQNQQQNNQNQQQNNQDKQNQDKQDQDKQNQDKQNQDKQNQDKQNNNQNQDQNQDKEDENNKNNPQPQQQISDDNAERLLDAAVQEEKRTQEKLNKAMQQPRKRILQKNW